MRGRILAGRDEPVIEDGAVVLDGDGVVAAMGPASMSDVAPGLPTYGGPGTVVAHGVVDAHVHLAFGAPGEVLAGGCVAVRDLGAPPGRAASWRSSHAYSALPVVAVAGPLLTAPAGYPSRSWGAGGFARFLTDPVAARAVVSGLAGSVDVVKLALEPAGGQPVPDVPTARAVVEAAHDHGLAVSCHALRRAMVERALDAGVDELCHTPTERLPPELVERIAVAGIPVVSTLHTHRDTGPDLMANARDLVAAGVPLVYGTDLGNAGTRPGVEPGELDLLAQAGLGADGAWWAATAGSAGTAGLRDRVPGHIAVGGRPVLVLLDADPRQTPAAARRPSAVLAGGRVVLRGS